MELSAESSLRSLLIFFLHYFRRQRFSQRTCAVPGVLKAISRTFLLQVRERVAS